MHAESDCVCFCSVKGVIDVISKKWALLIVNTIGNYGTLRFNKIKEELQSISPKTLSDTLKKLVTEGLIERTPFAEIPPRVEYSLTKDGKDFRQAIIPLLEWAASRNNHQGKKCVPIYRRIPAHRVIQI